MRRMRLEKRAKDRILVHQQLEVGFKVEGAAKRPRSSSQWGQRKTMKMWPHISQEKKFEDKLKRGREKGGTRSCCFSGCVERCLWRWWARWVEGRRPSPPSRTSPAPLWAATAWAQATLCQCLQRLVNWWNKSFLEPWDSSAHRKCKDPGPHPPWARVQEVF